jgi:hypothetical protein
MKYVIKNNNAFIPLPENEIIKVPKCTYSNDVKYSTTYYFCQCSEDLFYPICISCADKCHKHHEPSLKMEGIYQCQCGMSNHNIGTEHDERLLKRRETTSNICMFSKFFSGKNGSDSRGFYLLKLFSNNDSMH